MKTYFAHPYDSIDSDGEKRLLEYMAKEGWEVINPFENDPLDETIIENIKSGKFSSLEATALVENDLIHILECDAILVWIPKGFPSIGTICEMVFAATQSKKWVMVIHERSSPHSWVVHYADELYLSIEDFINEEGYSCYDL